MGTIFGKKTRPGEDNGDFLTEHRAEEKKSKDKQDNNAPSEEGGQADVQNQESPGQPDNENEDLNQQTDTINTDGEENEEVEDSKEQDNKKLAGKFDNRASLVDSISNLGEKLGRKVDPVKVSNSTNEELEEVYKELESELGRTSDVDETRQQNQQLKQRLEQTEQQLQQLRQYNQQMSAYLKRLSNNQSQQQQPQQPNQQQIQQQPNNQQSQTQVVRDPKTGRFVRRQVNQQQTNQNNQQQQQNNQQQQQDSQQKQDYNPKELLRTLYKDPMEFWNKMQELTQNEKQQVRDNMDNQQKQLYQQQQEQMQKQQREQMRYQEYKMAYDQQVNDLKNKYGEKFDNEETKSKIQKYLRNHPIYRNPKLFPNGLEIAYKNVKAAEQNQSTSQQQTEQLTNQKKAAGMPRSQGSNIRSNDSSDEEEQELDRIFGKSGGMFNN